MSWRKIKISQADRLFSLVIRHRDKWTCQRCFKSYGTNMQNSHFWGRGMLTVRFDPENCDTLCIYCHEQWGGYDRDVYTQFKIKQLGQKRFDALEARARLIGKKPDEALIRMWCRQELTKMGIEKPW